MTPIIIRHAHNRECADQQVRELTAELRDDYLAPAILDALDTIALPDTIDRQIRDWIAEIHAASPGDAFDLARLLDTYKALVVLFVANFRYRFHWRDRNPTLGTLPRLEMIEKTPPAAIQRMQTVVGHLALALHGEPARDPLRDVTLTEPELLRSIAEKAVERIERAPRPV